MQLKMAALPEADISVAWWSQRRRNITVLGTWEEEAFQVSLRRRDSSEDPLPVDIFAAYHCVPHCGVYGFNEYNFALPRLVILLPSSAVVEGERRLLSLLPSPLQNSLRKYESHQLEVFILIHQPPQFEAAVEPDATEINLIYHNWLFKNEDMTGEENLQEIIDVGLFQPFNVSETKQNTCGGDTELLDGIPFGRLGPRVVELHEGMFSPQNLQLSLLQNRSVHSFYTCSCAKDGRCILAYHILTTKEEVNSAIFEAIKESETVGDLLNKLKALSHEHLQIQHPLDEILKLLNTI